MISINMAAFDRRGGESSSPSEDRDEYWIPHERDYPPDYVMKIRDRLQTWTDWTHTLRVRQSRDNWDSPSDMHALVESVPMDRFMDELPPNTTFIRLNQDYNGYKLRGDLPRTLLFFHFYLFHVPGNPAMQCAVSVEEHMEVDMDGGDMDILSTGRYLLFAGEEYYIFRALLTGHWNHDDGIRYQKIMLKANREEEPATFRRFKAILSTLTDEFVDEIDAELRRQVRVSDPNRALRQ